MHRATCGIFSTIISPAIYSKPLLKCFTPIFLTILHGITIDLRQDSTTCGNVIEDEIVVKLPRHYDVSRS